MLIDVHNVTLFVSLHCICSCDAKAEQCERFVTFCMGCCLSTTDFHTPGGKMWSICFVR